MGEKQKNTKNDGENNKDAGKKEETPSNTTVVLKMDMHCDGCTSKIIRCLRSFQGVESVKAESEVGKLTITGKLDPSKVSDKLAQKMKKKVDLISPHPNKDKNNNSKPQDNNKKPKEKEPPVTTVVLKVALHCQGCMERIRKTVFKTKGVHEVAIDKEKETVTVKGTMDAKALVGNLMRRLKRKVEVVPPKKDSKDNKDADRDKEGAEKAGSDARKNKKKGGGGGGGGDNGDGGGDGEGKMKQTKMVMESPAPVLMPYGYSYGYDYYGYNYGPLYMGQVHAPQIFSDENPNACSIM